MIIGILLSTPAISGEKASPERARILKNWAAAQAGALAGWGIAGLSLRTLDWINVVDLPSSSSGGNRNLMAGVMVFSHLSCNYLVKRQAKQTTSAFLENLLFSSTPVVMYALMVKPDLGEFTSIENIKKDIGIVLTSMFLTPVFAAIGNEIFNRQPHQTSTADRSGMQPYFAAGDQSYQVGVRLSF